MSSAFNVIPQSQNEENVEPMDPFKDPTIDASPIKNKDSSHQNHPPPSPKMTPIWTGGIRGSERVATKQSQLEELNRPLQEKEKRQMEPSASVTAPAPKPPKVLPVWTGGVRGSTRVAEKMSVIHLEEEKRKTAISEKIIKKIPKICKKCAEAKRNKRKLSTSTHSEPVERIWNRPIPDFSDSKRWVKIKLPEGVEVGKLYFS